MIIIGSLMFSAFFSGIEIAFVSANRLQVELEKELGKYSSRIISLFLQNRSRFVAALLVGNNICLVVYGIYMGKLIINAMFPAFSDSNDIPVYVILAQTIISTLIVLITAEFLPKAIFRINPNRILNFFSFFLFFIYYVALFLPALVINWISKIILTTFLKVDVSDSQPIFGKIDLNNYLRSFTEIQDEEAEMETEIQLFQNALEFDKIKARECMVPRNEILAFDLDENLEMLRKNFIEKGYSKILIYRDSIDNIIGYVHCNELFRKPESLKSILLPIIFIAESTPADQILKEFIKKKRHLAVVLDEFGGTAGMLTIEDIVEEIFGEIKDEHDQEELLERQTSQTEYHFSARHEIDYLNEKYKLGLPEGEDYDTLAGLLIDHFEDIPPKNSIAEIGKFKFSIIKVGHNKIESVKLNILD
ncbi:MAG: HlyC/CorC family transporter [Flavobacteriales bacterium]|nr:HlyC/CorC family transporter [Flavobacteriales bacterium]